MAAAATTQLWSVHDLVAACEHEEPEQTKKSALGWLAGTDEIAQP